MSRGFVSLALLCLLGCDIVDGRFAGPAPIVRSPFDAGSDPGDAGLDDGGAMVDAGLQEAFDGGLVAVAHARELRGVWVATVSGLDFPSQQGAAAQQAELGRIVETCADAGLNAIFFQIRPESDALYASTRDPWSRVLTGSQGQDPGYDPLAVLLRLAKAKGIEVHAWVNPYRAKANSTAQVASGHISRQLSQHAVDYPRSSGGLLTMMDPSAPAVRQWVVDEVTEVARRYDVDGVHFDDYFYPYPVNGAPFADEAPFQAYRSDGGVLSKNDWRRDNVNQLIRQVSQSLAEVRPALRFSVSPFGIYRPGQPQGVTGLDAYDAIACDPLKWLRERWVDSISPQLYWPTNRMGQRFDVLVDWWNRWPTRGQSLMPGLNASAIGTTGDWSVAEFRAQVRLTRGESEGRGHIWFSFSPIRDNRQGLRTLLQELYSQPALTPPVAAVSGQLVPAPRVSVQAGRMLQLGSSAEMKAYTLYRWDGDAYRLMQMVPASVTSVAVQPGRWAVAVANRASVESLAATVEVP